MPKWYLNPDGTLPTNADGKPMFVSEAQFKGCCCNMCQWRSEWEWDCEEGEWVQVGESEWATAQEEPGESEGLCSRIVWGEIVNCLSDPRPDEPPPPEVLTEEEIEECCPPAPCSCPCLPWPPSSWPCEGLLEQYSMVSMSSETKTYSTGSGCTGTPIAWRQTRLKSPVTLTASASTSCRWEGNGSFERRFYNFDTDQWGSWADISASFCFVNLNTVTCKWSVNAIGFGVPKSFGASPAGNYSGRQSDCGGTPPATIDVDITIS